MRPETRREVPPGCAAGGLARGVLGGITRGLGGVGRDPQPHGSEDKGGSGGAAAGQGRHLSLTLSPGPASCLPAFPHSPPQGPARRHSRVRGPLCLGSSCPFTGLTRQADTRLPADDGLTCLALGPLPTRRHRGASGTRPRFCWPSTPKGTLGPPHRPWAVPTWPVCPPLALKLHSLHPRPDPHLNRSCPDHRHPPPSPLLSNSTARQARSPPPSSIPPARGSPGGRCRVCLALCVCPAPSSAPARTRCWINTVRWLEGHLPTRRASPPSSSPVRSCGLDSAKLPVGPPASSRRVSLLRVQNRSWRPRNTC
nr:zinc finger protein ZFPM1-like [Ovis aries]